MKKIKSVQLYGTLKNGLSYKPYPVNEFSVSDWYIAIESATFESDIDVTEILNITCNFVTAQKYNENSQVETYEQPLAQAHLKLKGENRTALTRYSSYIINCKSLRSNSI